ncbi:MAG: hypothetical protein M0T70_01145 [Geobacteraceae bacterium]|nr:hypothetical protein [Geobacteraceae bacterium]
MGNEKPEINLPRRNYYTIEELAKYWQKDLGIADADLSVVEHYVNEGLLTTSLRYEWPDGRGWFFEDYPARTNMISACKQPPSEKYYIRLKDAERFEQEHFQTDSITRVKETAEELAIRLQQAGKPLHKIAGRLKSEFPNITAYRIGKLLPANPGANIDAESHKKQGNRLLKECKKLINILP